MAPLKIYMIFFLIIHDTDYTVVRKYARMLIKSTDAKMMTILIWDSFIPFSLPHEKMTFYNPWAR